MAAKKFLSAGILIVLCALSSAINCGKNKSHNTFFGQRRYGDMLLFMDRVKEEGSWLRTIAQEVVYPGTEDTPGNITFVEALDKYTDGNGGCVYLMSGGVGSTHVKLRVKSQRGSGLDFIIRIYGFRLWHYG